MHQNARLAHTANPDLQWDHQYGRVPNRAQLANHLAQPSNSLNENRRELALRALKLDDCVQASEKPIQMLDALDPRLD